MLKYHKMNVPTNFSGTEFKARSCKKLYKEKKIYFKQKNPPNKGRGF